MAKYAQLVATGLPSGAPVTIKQNGKQVSNLFPAADATAPDNRARTGTRSGALSPATFVPNGTYSVEWSGGSTSVIVSGAAGLPPAVPFDMATQAELDASGAGLAGAFAAIPAVADLPVIHVSVTGSDANDGKSWGKPKATIAAAVAALSAAPYNLIGLVKIGVGTHGVTSTISLPQSIYIEGSGSLGSSVQGTTVEWQGADDGSFVFATSSSVSGTDDSNGQITGLCVRPAASKPGGGAYTNVNGVYWRNAQNRARLRNLTIRDFPGTGLYADTGNGASPASAYPGYVACEYVWCTGNNINYHFLGGFTSLVFYMCAGDISANTTDVFIIDPVTGGGTANQGQYHFIGWKTEYNGAAAQNCRWFTVNTDVAISFQASSAHKGSATTDTFINYTVTPSSPTATAGTIPLTLTNVTTQGLATIVKGPDGAVWLAAPQNTAGVPTQIASWSGQNRTGGITYTGNPGPALHNLAAWSYDPTAANSAVVPVGALRGFKMQARDSRTLTAVPVAVLTGATCTNAYVGVFDATGALIGVSADVSATFAAAGTPSIAITVVAGKSLAVSAGDIVYVGILIGGGTSPGFAAPPGAATASMVSANLTAAGGYRAWTIGTGQTAMPTSVALGSTTNVAGILWCGIK